jgi:Type II secretion system (T2SS), protein E, N-terminal domain
MRYLFKPFLWPSRWGKRWEDTRSGCGLTSCPGPKSLWQRMWRRPNGTILQGTFYCQPECLETALAGQLRRLETNAPAAPPPNRIPLGLLMMARGRLTYREVEAALEAQRRGGYGKIGEWFEKLGFASEQEVTAALGLQWGCPVASSLEVVPIEPTGRIPLAILEAFYMLPLHYTPATKTLYLAFGERVDHAALYAIEKILDCRTQPCVAARKGVARQLENLRQQPRPGEVEFGPMHDLAEMGRVSSSYIAKLGAEDVRLVRLGRFIWLRLTARSASMNLLFRLPNEPARVRTLGRPSLIPSADRLQRALK